MSDMSFKQAKEIVERLELSEITLKSMLEKIEISNNKSQELLKEHQEILKVKYEDDKSILNLKLLIVINIGFIFGLLVSKYFL